MKQFTWLALAACAAVGACRDTTAVESGLHIDLRADRAVVDATHPAELTITVTNRSSRDVTTLDPRISVCGPAYVVLDARGDTLPPAVRYCALPGYPAKIIAPGDSIVLHDRWIGDRSGSGLPSIPAPAGQYQVVAQVFVDGIRRASAPVVVSVTR